MSDGLCSPARESRDNPVIEQRADPPLTRRAASIRDAWLAAILVAAVFAAYFPALRGGWLLDDDVHVTRPELRSVAGLARIWSEPGATQQYYPVVHTAFWVEHRLWGDAVLGYHVANVLLHALSACFVVALVRRLHLPGAWLAGFLFALHPVCVESVAWIAEQKNTLSGAFYLAAALVYLRFDRERRGGVYALALALFLLALLSKTATATLPAALLVIFWWQRGRIDGRRDVLPLVPWFAAAAIAGVVTIVVERALIVGIQANVPLSWIERGLVAGRALWFYFGKLLWPADLSFFYERWRVSSAVASQYLLPIAALVVAGGLIWLARRQRGPLAAFLIFSGTLIPVLGFLNVQWFVFSYVADHFQYFAALGLIVPAAVGLDRVMQKMAYASPRLALIAPAAVVTTLWAMTWRHSATFHDIVTLYATAVARTPGSVVAHHHLGVVLAEKPERLADAVAEIETALRLNPHAAEVHESLGLVLARLPERFPDALAHFAEALRLKPSVRFARVRLADFHFEQGKSLAATPGRTADAMMHYETAVQFVPEFAEAHYNLGNLLLQDPLRLPEAVSHFEAAVRSKPDFVEAHSNLGAALARLPGRLPDAIRHFKVALQVDPNFAPARNNLRSAEQRLSEIRTGIPAEIP